MTSLSDRQKLVGGIILGTLVFIYEFVAVAVYARGVVLALLVLATVVLAYATDVVAVMPNRYLLAGGVVVGLVIWVTHVYLVDFVVRGSTVGYFVLLTAVLLDARSDGIERGGQGSADATDATPG